MQATDRLPLAAILAVVLVPACGGGGGGSGGGTLDEGLYSRDDFDYQDPHAPGFHPIGTESAVLTARDELVILDVPQDPATARGTLFDDIGTGAGVLAELADVLGAGQYRTGAAGNLDDDAEEELVLVRIAGSTFQVSVVGRDTAGTLVPAGGFTIPSTGFPYREARISLGDVDGDHRDEIMIVARRFPIGDVATSDVWMRVFDDPLEGFALLHELDWPFAFPRAAIEDLQAVAADMDRDGRAEIALLAQRSSSGVNVHLRLLEDAGAGFAERVPWFEVEDFLQPGNAGSRLLTGDFDGDGHAELAVATWSADSSFYEATLQSFALEGSTLRGAAQRRLLGSFGSPGLFFRTQRAWDAVALDRDADGADEVALLLPLAPGLFAQSKLVTQRWDGAAWQDDLTLELPFGRDDGAALVATDDDADGQDELYFCRMHGSSSSATKTRLAQRIDFGDPHGPVTQSWTSTAQSSGPVYPPVLVAADVDADGFAIRFTGRTFTSLSDPMPLVVLSAAPTKAGISQNYGGTSTSYAVTSGSSQSYGVASSVTASAYVGSEVSGLFGLFGVSARETIASTLTTSETATVRESFVQDFTGPFDADAIVFQGTLYHSYEYEILAAPESDLVGTLFSLDVPVQSRVYKWSVDYYNARVDPRLRIGPDVLSHTIGDPTSYPRRAEIDALTSRYVGWSTNDSPPMSVGQGGGLNSLAIELEEESTTTEERTLGVTWETGFSAGGVELGGSFGLSTLEAYTVTVSELTTYEGAVGDISSVTDYEAWRYEWGFGVYHRGVLADATNHPVGMEPGVLPYEVVRFWTNPVGTAD